VSPDGQNLDTTIWLVLVSMKFSSTSLAITRATSRSTPHSKTTSGRTSRRFWWCGARTIRSYRPPGAEAFKRDIPEAKVRFFDTGHFALETHYAEIAKVISDFLDERAGK
jgi:hypothetical protein